MKQLYSPFVLLLFCMLSGVSAWAQLHISKDNMACAYGLKNEAGQWVVQPGYTYIDDVAGGCFNAMVGERNGIFSPEGKLIVPFVYEHILSIRADHYKGFFIAKMSADTSYVYTSEGKKLFGRSYSNIYQSENYLVLQTIHRDSVFSSCADFSGRMLFENVYGNLHVVPNSPFFIVTEYIQDGDWPSSRSGVIDSTGKQVIPILYNQINYCKGNFSVTTQDLKQGVIDKNNQFLLRPDYHVYANDNRGVSCIVPETLCIIENEAKQKGLLFDFKVALQPEFTAIYPFFEDRPDRHMFIWRDRKVGVYSEKAIIPAIYDEINRVGIPGQEDFFYACRVGAKWGLLNSEGKLIIDMNYDSYQNETDYQNMQYGIKPGICMFSKGKDMYAVDLSQPKIQAVKMERWSEGADYRIFSYKGNLYPFQLHPRINIWMYLHPNSYAQINKRYSERIFIGFDGDIRIFDLHGKRLDQHNVLSLQYSILRCKNDKVGMIDKITGKLLLDTIYSEIISIYHQKQMLAQRYQKQEWVVLDTLGKLKTQTVFDTIPNDNIARSNQLYGIVDHTMNWIVKPIYKSIVCIYRNDDERLFYAETPSGELAILNETGKIIVPAEYKELIPVFKSGYYDEYTDKLRSDLFPSWWMMRNGNRRMFFNNLGQIRVMEPSDKKTSRFADSLLFNAAFVNDDIEYYDFFLPEDERGKMNDCNDCFTIHYYGSDSVFQKVPYKRAIYEAFSQIYVTGLPCFQNLSLKIDGSCNVTYDEWYHIGSFGQKFASAHIQRYYHQNEARVTIRKNYIWKENRLQEVSLNDIFGSGTALRDEFVYAIQHGEYELDCSTPDKMLEQIGDDFYLDKSGIVLNLSSSQHILITAERLKARKETKWFAGYLE